MKTIKEIQEDKIKVLKNFRDNPHPQSMLSDLACIALEVIKELQRQLKTTQDSWIFQMKEESVIIEQLQEENRKLKEQLEEAFRKNKIMIDCAKANIFGAIYREY